MPPTEAELIRLHTAYAESAFRFAWSITKDESLAQDVLQELFLKLARDASAIANARSERALILTITRHLALDTLRRTSRREGLHQRWTAELPQWFEPALNHEFEEQQQQLTAALAELPEEQRSAVHLHLWEGLGFREIGEMQNLPTQTIASRYRYALAKLRTALQSKPTITP